MGCAKLDAAVEGAISACERVGALENVKREGVSAANGGKDRSDCPHPPGHALGKAWRAGYDSVAARKMATGANRK